MSTASEDQKKRERWFELWEEIRHLIAMFEADYGHPTPEDEAWAARLAERMREHVARLRRNLQLEHPDMPAIAEQPTDGASEQLPGQPHTQATSMTRSPRRERN